eukprot:SAG31_NODE_3576_length_4107_cov_4.203593_3_plen_76_part_00
MYSESLLPSPAQNGGYTVSGIMHAVDWIPTILAAVGADPPAVKVSFELDGINQWDMISRKVETGPRQLVLLELVG